MKIKNSLPTAPVNYFSREQLLYALLPNKSSVQFATFDANTFEGLNAFRIDEKLHHNQAILHDDRLFLITMDGIIGYDTFTGDQVVYMQTGSLVPLSMEIMGDKLVILCGITLVRNKKVSTGNFCICVHNINNGRKLAQSQTMNESPVLTLSDGIWFVLDGFLYKLSEDCEIIGQLNLLARSDMPLVATEDHIVAASTMGTLELFHKETMRRYTNMVVGRTNSPPLACDNTLLWFTGAVLNQISVSEGSVSKICEIQNTITSSLVKAGNDIYAADEKSNLVKVSLGPPVSIEVLQLSGRLWKPIHVGGHIFIASDRALYQIEV